MGNCALKPKVLSGNGAPAPEELKDSLLEDQKIDAAKSLSKLFLQDKVEKQTKDDEKVTSEKIPVTEDLKTALAKAKSPTKETKSQTKEVESPTTEAKSPKKEVQSPIMEAKTPVDVKEVIDDVIVKETVTESKTEEVKEAAAMKEA